MKTFKKTGNRNLFEIILPFDSASKPDGEELFDDCPLCQELKKQLENGEAFEVDEEVH